MKITNRSDQDCRVWTTIAIYDKQKVYQSNNEDRKFHYYIVRNFFAVDLLSSPVPVGISSAVFFFFAHSLHFLQLLLSQHGLD